MKAASVATPPVISDADFQKFAEFFHRKTGIHFEVSKRYFVDKRLIERIQATGAESFRAWFVALRFEADGAEMQHLVNLMTVNETYFFREAYQFDCLVNNMLNEVAARKAPGSRIRIWSIPSSTGEEPYSIAIYLLERWAKIEQYDVEILSSDIDTKVLEAAQRGVYSSRSVAQLPAPYLKKYFTPQGGGEWRISRELVEAVEFSRVNLSEPADMRRFRDIDVIFCRNLLIYFDDLSRRVAAEAMFDTLAPGGFICLGHSESMSRMSSLFTMRRFPDALVYQRPL
ncbi:MAG: protein-glutamate O-methyltransferase CheR [Methylibium sp.]|uniref:CheR family methyltransferase n=1 Tax=Methylibium sp. TaxID=2067992 RepID=UPI00179CDF40|nr:protein-glutamate O-methyltransferase CheR [Methylibium sp.]MBA2722757.1 protein-glutamate O-methyltransferase CheR [Methylibium sp.]MBA3591788.1 protein-glutamate O-methyltransferase CheR [Methylibium sp.]